MAPLTGLTSTLKWFEWSKEAEAAFSKLKTVFTSALILCHQDPSCQFIVEVDSSDVGAVLSQREVMNQKGFFQAMIVSGGGEL